MKIEFKDLHKSWNFWSIICYICYVILIWRGTNRITSYHLSEGLHRHVFVDGDAYNYIINSNILVGYFLLAGSLIIAGTIFLCVGQIIKLINKSKNETMNNYSQVL